MRIGQASSTSGVSARALRHYEREGLIVPGRHDNGYRDYCISTIDRVRVVKDLLDAGLSIRLVQQVLPVVLEGRPLEGDVRRDLEAYRDRLAERSRDLDRRRSALEGFLERHRA